MLTLTQLLHPQSLLNRLGHFLSSGGADENLFAILGGDCQAVAAVDGPHFFFGELDVHTVPLCHDGRFYDGTAFDIFQGDLLFVVVPGVDLTDDFFVRYNIFLFPLDTKAS